MYASPWFLTLYSAQFRFDLLVRIFDVYLLEGQKVIYRIALGLMKTHEGIFYDIMVFYLSTSTEKILKGKHMEDVLIAMKVISDNIDVEDLMDKAFGFAIKRSHLKVFLFLLNDNILKEYEDAFNKLIQTGKTDEILEQCIL